MQARFHVSSRFWEGMELVSISVLNSIPDWAKNPPSFSSVFGQYAWTKISFDDTKMECCWMHPWKDEVNVKSIRPALRWSGVRFLPGILISLPVASNHHLQFRSHEVVCCLFRVGLLSSVNARPKDPQPLGLKSFLVTTTLLYTFHANKLLYLKPGYFWSPSSRWDHGKKNIFMFIYFLIENASVFSISNKK